ncbi:Uncharacterised protein [Cellulomonas fimi]|nr:Uncharacterised protein [Cellulomonas fimi]
MLRSWRGSTPKHLGDVRMNVVLNLEDKDVATTLP